MAITNPRSAGKEYLTWEQYGQAARELAVIVADDGYRPDIILGIARGGMFLTGSLGYGLAVKNIYMMNVEYYTGEDTRLDVPVMLPPYLDLADLSGSKVLLADDVADTGHTLELVRDFCAGKTAETRIAVLHEKPKSAVRCDYVWQHTELWVEYPWAVEEPVIAAKTAAGGSGAYR